MKHEEMSSYTFHAGGGESVHLLVMSLQQFVKLHLSCLFGLPKLAKMLDAVPTASMGSFHRGSMSVKKGFGRTDEFFVCTKAQANSLKLVFAHVPWLKKLDDQILENLLQHFVLHAAKTGQTIIRKGDEALHWFLLLHGSVAVVVPAGTEDPSEPAKTREICRLHPVSSFGERGILHKCPVTATIVAVDDCVCAALTREAFLEVMSPRILSLLKTSLPMMTGGGGAASGDAPPMLTETGTKFKLKELKHLGLLGKGSFGKVILVESTLSDHLDRRYALKCVRLKLFEGQNAEDPKVILRERAIMMELDHPFIPRLHATFKDSMYVYFLMDHYQCGTLEDLQASRPSNRLQPGEARFYTASIVSMCEYLHRRGIVHRDLKTQNLLLDDEGHPNLIDFGLAAKLGMGERTFTVCGSPMYVAPEVLNKSGHGAEVDWWSLGVMVYYFLASYTPFTSANTVKSVPRLFHNIVSEDFQIEYPSRVDDDARGLIALLLDRNPSARVGFQVHNGALFIKQNAYFADFDWEALLSRNLPAPFKPKAYRTERDDSGEDMSLIPPMPDIEALSGCLCFGGVRILRERMWYDEF